MVRIVWKRLDGTLRAHGRTAAGFVLYFLALSSLAAACSPDGPIGPTGVSWQDPTTLGFGARCWETIDVDLRHQGPELITFALTGHGQLEGCASSVTAELDAPPQEGVIVVDLVDGRAWVCPKPGEGCRQLD